MPSLAVALLLSLLAACGTAQPQPQQGPIVEPPASQPAAAEQVPPARIEYLGRRIAQTMHWRGAEWLMRATRENEEHAARMLDALQLQPGMVVCDLGCGNGFHTLPMAERVGAEGKVFAVDIQKQMLALLARRQARAGLENVQRVLGAVHDPNLPEASCDLVLLVDVYHEFSHPESMLQKIRAALKPGGRVALVEFRGEDPEVPIKPLHKMTRVQMDKELLANGFTVVGSHDALPWQHLVFYGVAPRAEQTGR